MFAKKQTPKPTVAKKGRVNSTHINLRTLPDGINGVPEEFLAEYEIRAVISGTKQITWNVYEKTGTTGKFPKEIPMEEILRLARAPGFVRANEKAERRDESNMRALCFYFNLIKEANLESVKNPKILVETIRSWSENLEANLKLLRDYEPVGREDQVFKKFLVEMYARAMRAASYFFETRLKGDERMTESEIFCESGFPQSLKGKFLTGRIQLNPNGLLWSSVVGKELSRFCTLTIREILEMNPNNLKIFGLETGNEFRKTETLAKYLGTADPWEMIPQVKKDGLLKKSVPMKNLLTKLETLIRYKQTRERVALVNETTSAFQAVDEWINKLLKSSYHAPPTNIADIKPFWEKLAGNPLMEPNIASADYREQTIEILSRTQGDFEEIRSRDELLKSITIWGYNPLQAMEVEIKKETTAGKTEYKNEDFEKFKPRQLGFTDGSVKKKKIRRPIRKSVLTRGSKKWFNLTRSIVGASVLEEMRYYLESFVEERIQEMAAKIVYMTCELTEKEARVQVLHEDEEEEVSEFEDEGDNDNPVGDEIPPPFKSSVPKATDLK